MSQFAPPAYDIGLDSEEKTPSGFPAGYFIIKNCASERLLDIATNATADGTHAVLWTSKDKNLELSMRSPSADNQIFFVDYTGALCSKSSGHALDIEDDHLVLRHRKPFTTPFPSPESHPLPRITWSSRTKELRVTVEYDPSCPTHIMDQTNVRYSRDYVVAAIPLRKPPSFFGKVFSHHDVAHSPLLGNEDEIDDSPEEGRQVCVREHTSYSTEKSSPTSPTSPASPERSTSTSDHCRWEVIPLRTNKPQPRRSTSVPTVQTRRSHT